MTQDQRSRQNGNREKNANRETSSPKRARTDTAVDPRELVSRLASDRQRAEAFAALVALGSDAEDAVAEGLRHGHWQVRRWCAIWFDENANPARLPELVPLLHDPKSKVRLWAVHSLACEHRHEASERIDPIPLLIERVQNDESLRVRRHAVVMLAYQHAHPDLTGFFQQLLDTETDPKLHKHAGIGLYLCGNAEAREAMRRRMRPKPGDAD
ncbi:MAG: hypothetical protein MJE66_15605 [Proteobacteria bacterium]|nr:hypothetical protein [Pseudomonadota bacterium]